MKLEVYKYWPTIGTSLPATQDGLPDRIRADLLKGPRVGNSIVVEASKTDTIRAIDAYLGIGKAKAYLKEFYVEADLPDSTDYSRFLIRPEVFEMNEEVYVDISRPTCDVKPRVCPWGSRLESAVKVKESVLERLGIGIVGRVWAFNEIELLLSEDVKTLFEREGLSGVAYSQCNYWRDDPGSAVPAPAFLGRLTEETFEEGSEIIFDEYCPTHQIVWAPHVFERRIAEAPSAHSDFVKVSRLKIGSKEFRYYKPLWIISRRCLDVLLENKILGLRYAGRYMDHVFRPIVVK